MFFKLDENTKHLVEEISALSGIQREIIREVWEHTLFRWVEQITRDPKKLQVLQIPFLGNVGVRYKGDTIKDTGEMDTQIDAYIAINDQFKSIIRDIYEDKTNVVINLLDRKINKALDNSFDESS